MLKKWFNPIDDIISVIAISVISFLTIINVICRFVLNSPISWAEEITLGCFIWLVFIGISSAMKRDGHIGVDYFIQKMPKAMRNVCTIIGAAAIYFVLIYIFIYLGFELASQAGSKVTPVLGISYTYIDLAVPIGGFLTAIHFTIKLIRSFQTNPEKKERA
ncbi:TRAP transporter small permease [Fredinandcohnia onubensis]|jgi:TRAP-type transport system small permease protein|uniref:TRAP transporter small permease n=1 Tax=Fredinandcohnia onubensis TaxID=1571209 RepID=UPI000C0BF178|nr:TRAP transporter small permease [Fredinandcohnia onubensis]